MTDDIFLKPLRVVYYARVSTEKDGQLNSLDNQISYFENFIKSNEYWQFCGGYVDEGISGTSVNARVNFLKMINDAENNRFDLIVTKEISRFSRNTLDSIMYTRSLLKCGVGVYFQADNINTLSPDSELRLTIMSAVAQDEVRRISERIKFGFRQSVADGKVLGTGSIIGYKKQNGVLEIDEEGAYVVEKIFKMYAIEKLGIRQISRHLENEGLLNSNGNPYTFSTIRNILSNPKYKGFYCGNKYENIDIRYGKKTKLPQDKWVVHSDENVPAIVDEDLWNRANEILAQRSGKYRGCANQSRYAYSGKIFCAFDGASFHRTVFNGSKEAWICAVKRQNGKKCNNFVIYTNELDAIMQKIFESEVDFDYIANTLCGIYKKCATTRKKTDNSAKIKKLTSDKARLLQLLLDGVVSNDDYKAKLTEIDNKLKLLGDTDKNECQKMDFDLIKNEITASLNGGGASLYTVLIKKITVGKISENMAEVCISLKNGKEYNVSYIKKGSRILGMPELKLKTV